MAGPVNAEGNFVIGCRRRQYIPCRGVPTENIIDVLAGKPVFVITDFVEDPAKAPIEYHQFVETVNATNRDFDEVASEILAGIDDVDHRERVESYIDAARWTQETALRIWEHDKKLIASLGITADDLREFPYDVPELGEDWSQYLEIMTMPLLLHRAQFSEPDEPWYPGYVAIRKWMWRLQK